MKKTIYVAIASRINADSFDLIATYDRAEAQDAIERDIAHLTPTERTRYEHYIDERTVEVEDGESAKDAYKRLLLDDEW